MYIILRGFFKIERYRDPDPVEDIIDDDEDEYTDEDGESPSDLKSNGPFGNSQFGQKFGGLMRASLLNQLQVSTQKSN